jgi:hypothetical protein
MMPNVRPACRLLAAGIVLGLPFGCESGKESLALVRGRVSYKGIALRSGTIVFTPDVLRGTTGPMARSEIQSDGSYTLQTNGAPGAIPGWHRVTVMCLESKPLTGPNGELNLPRSLIPEKYRDPELSGLSCEVRGGQVNGIDFDLD